MEIEIKNFGPIDNLKFDLKKDLHLIYGKNAIGKSYATYCIYCLIKNIKNKRIRKRYFYSNQIDNAFEKKFKAKLKTKNFKSLDISEEYCEFVVDELKEVILKGLHNSFKNTFSSLQNLENQYSNKKFEITIHISNQQKIFIKSKTNEEIDLDYTLGNNTIKIVQKNTKTTKFSLYTNSKMIYGRAKEDEFIKDLYNGFIDSINTLLEKLDFNIRDIYYLPASRSGLYQALNAFTPILAELTQNRFFIQNKSIELPSLTEPLSDYFIDLSTLNKNQNNKEFKDIINSLENDILQGQVDYDEETKRILYKPNGLSIELNLSQVSSMVAELSPLVLYFKHILNNKFSSNTRNDKFFFDPYYDSNLNKTKGYDIIFIEEPEAHLHPEVQVKLIEIFAKLSTLKLKIFITSHSNYMFNKINNLLIKNEIDANKMMVYHLVKTKMGTKLNSDMEVSQDGINDENFQDVTEKLYYERLKALEGND